MDCDRCRGLLEFTQNKWDFLQNFDKTGLVTLFRIQCGWSAHVHLSNPDHTLLFTIALLLLHILHLRCLAGGLGGVLLPVTVSIVSRLSSRFESRNFSIAVHKIAIRNGSLFCYLSARPLSCTSRLETNATPLDTTFQLPTWTTYTPPLFSLIPLNAELNPICHLLALLGGATIVVVSRLGVNKAQWILYLSPGTTLNNPKSCSQRVFLYFAWISLKKAIISLYGIN